MQSNLTYEKEFALEMQKAKVLDLPHLVPSVRLSDIVQAELPFGLQDVHLAHEVCDNAGGKSKEHTLGLILQTSARDSSW